MEQGEDRGEVALMRAIGCAFPRSEADRRELMEAVERITAVTGAGGGKVPPLPAIHPDAVDIPCKGCKRILAVGPKVWAQCGDNVACPVCLIAMRMAGTELHVDTMPIDAEGEDESEDSSRPTRVH